MTADLMASCPFDTEILDNSICKQLAAHFFNRGIRDEQEARKYLDPRLSDLRPPEGPLPMAGFALAADRLKRAVIDREVIGIFGDYDVDGITTCALLTDFMNRAGANVSPRVARRGASVRTRARPCSAASR